MKVNTRENKTRLTREHKVGDKVFMTHVNNSFVQPRKLSEPQEDTSVTASERNSGT